MSQTAQVTKTGNAGKDTLTGIEEIWGSTYGDSFVGDSAADTFRGASGDDIMSGGANTDTLYGDAGDDTLTGGADNDTLYGGAHGTIGDTADFTNESKVVVTLAEGATATITAGTNEDILFGIENITGSNTGNDTITGDNNSNILKGLGGDDTINGGAGADKIYGGAEIGRAHV